MFASQADLNAETVNNLYSIAMQSVTTGQPLNLKRKRFESRNHFAARVVAAEQGIRAAQIAVRNAH